MATSKGQVPGIGAVISYVGATGADDPTPSVIGEPTDAKFSGRKRDVADSTSFASGGIKGKLGTILDLGQMSVTCVRVPADPGQVAVVTANVNGGSYDFTVQLPLDAEADQTTKGDLITISGIVTEANFDVPLTKVGEFTFTVDITAYTVTPGS
jgi:hypothetical protein